VKLDLGTSSETIESAQCQSCGRGYRKEGLIVAAST
jgi:hypothetical protein